MGRQTGRQKDRRRGHHHGKEVVFNQISVIENCVSSENWWLGLKGGGGGTLGNVGSRKLVPLALPHQS